MTLERRPLASRAFRAAMHLLPRSFDPRDADELCAVFDALAADARRAHGWPGALATLSAELPGLARLVVAEWLAAGRARRADRRRRRLLASYHLPYSQETSMLDSVWQDARFAVRALRKHRSFTAIAIATLALGIGANTAIFSVVHGVLLEPLPFADPDRIVTVMSPDGAPTPSIYGSSPANFVALREGTSAARHIGAFSTRLVTLTGQRDPESLQAVTTVGDLFGVFGIRPLLGRTLMPDDDSPASAAVVVLSYDAWQRLFGGDRSVVGQTVTIDRRPRVVVGVMPPDFRFAPAPADLWMPEQWSPEYAANRDQYYLQVVAKLAPGETLARFSAQLEAVAARLRADYATYNTDLHLSATLLRDTIVSNVRTRLLVLMGAVLFLLLITCVNLANLQLARASTRESEFAVRRALGAERGRMARQLLTESLLLALGGGVAGTAVGVALMRIIIAAQRTSMPRIDEVSLDATALAFTLVVSLAAGVLFGILPALRVSTVSSLAALRQGTRGSIGHHRSRSALVVAELAVALVLLTGAGLLVRSFAHLNAVDSGVRTEQLLTMRLSVGANAAAAVEASLERIRAIPGVRGAAVTSQLPITGRGIGAWLNIMDRPTPPNETPPGEAYRVVTPEYFTTMGIPLLRGRLLGPDDRADRAPAVVVNEALARKYWPTEDPIGKEIQLGAPGNYLNPPSPIVGVVANTRDAGLDADPLPAVYLPLRVMPGWPAFTFVVRTSGRPEAVTSAVRRELRAAFPTTAIRNVQTMDVVLHDALAPARLSMGLIGAFALVALVTAALGVFGVLSFAVAQRTRELGIRMALGASPRDVRRMVVINGGQLALAGLILGLAGSFALTRFIATMLYGVEPRDPLTFGAVSAILLGIGVLASWVPARRATRIDPIAALRAE